MPRDTGAGLAPTQVIVPETTVLPPRRTPVYDKPLPPRVDHHRPGYESGGAPNSNFNGPLPAGGTVSAGSSGRQGRFAYPSGFSANALYHDDNLSLGIHLGTAGNAWRGDCWNPWWTSCSWYNPCRPAYDRWCGPSYAWCEPSYAACYPWGWSSWPYYSDYSYTLPVTSSSYVMYQDPALSPSYSPNAGAPQAVAAVPTDFDRASYLMLDRRYAEAVTAFRAVIKSDPGDAPARRWLGIALLLQNRTQDGAAEIARAYSIDSTLSDASPDLEAMGLTVRQMTDLCAPVITYARRVNSSAGYVAAAMLMQIRSRPDLAVKMLNSAREAGLDSTMLVNLTQGMAR